MDPSIAGSRLGQPARFSHIASSPLSAHQIPLPDTPHRHSQHPSRVIRQEGVTDEKVDPASLDSSRLGSRPARLQLHSPLPSNFPSSSRPHPSPLRSASLNSSASSSFSSFSRSASSSAYTRPRGLRIANLLKPWIPIILYAITSLGFLAAIAFWKKEVFQGLDQLSHWLQSDEYLGHAVIFFLIFLTTFPPLPLYSTLIILSGYTFGPWTGAIISYWASLLGALTVFILSRLFFRDHISRWLECSITIKRVVRAIEKRPKLLFLIRLAPYPFNVMNCLLAASPTLTLRTYTICTALSLFKLIIHTSIGSSIHSFAEFHVNKPGRTADESMLGHYSTIIGIGLCVAIFVYLSYIARKAVDEELEEEPLSREETMAFLSDDDHEGQQEEMMIESSLRSSRPSLVQQRHPDINHGDRFEHGGREEASIGLS